MKSRTIFIGIILLQVILPVAFAQNNELNFQLVEGPNGKPLGKITGITQDPRGYMWFGGQHEKCLYRYDGNRVISFRHIESDSNSLDVSDIETVYADNAGMIWIGGNGLDRYNPATRIFKHYRQGKNDSTWANRVFVILKDRNGQLWVGTNKGLDRLDEETGEFLHYRNEPGNAKSLSNNRVWTIYEDHGGAIWIGTGTPWDNQPLEGGLNRLNPDGTFTRYLHDPRNPHSLISNKVRAIFEDSKGVFWVGTSGDGLHTMDREKGSFERHPYDKTKPDELSRPPLKYGGDHITFINEDRTGAIWIGTYGAGLSRYNSITKKITHYQSSNGFPDSTSWNGFVSHDGVLWISTEDSNLLYRVDPFNKFVTSISTGNAAISYLEDKEGYLWVGSFGSGLFKYDQHRNLVHQFKHDPSNPFSLLGNTVVLFQDKGDTVWARTENGLRILNKSTQQFTWFNEGGNLKDSTGPGISRIIQDKQGYKWIGNWGEGLVRYGPNNSFKYFLSDARDSSSIASDFVNIIFKDRSGTLWAGGPGGLNRLDQEGSRFRHYLPGNFIRSLYEDSAGGLWVGTENGLFRYDSAKDQFSGFLDSQSEINTSATGGIGEDNEKNLWFASHAGIVKLNPFSGEVFIYAGKFGINPASLLLLGETYRNRKGELFISHQHGFYTFSPEELAVKTELKINITDCFINALPLLPGKESLQQNPVEEIRELDLTYNQNNISFNFAAMDYREPEAIKYFTMLEHYDNTWREAAGEKSSYYFNISPGDYIYRVKAFNADGTKAEKTIFIHIHPPWWITWWAYAGYVLIIAAALAGARRSIIQRERLKSNLTVTQLEKEKQHILLEKAKETERIKTSFFTNISHEFRTPLTLIKGPAQNLLEEFYNKPKIREQLESIQRNSDLVLKLINQLLDLAKLETGNLTVNYKEGDLNSRLNACIHSFSSAALQKEINFIVEMPPIRYQASFDNDKLETILNNLVGNAIKFTPPHGQVSVRVITKATSFPEGQLIFTVSDNGIGIPVEHQEKIFERFYQVNEGGAHTEVGTGIGLALVKELTELMGGRISVTAGRGKGSVFEVVLPLHFIKVLEGTESQTAPEIATLTKQEVANQEMSGNGVPEKPRVLVVEDNADLRKFIITSLGSNYDFLEASDGKEALDVAVNESPELIISDVMMPRMDGITMTGKIREDIRISHIPVILLTAKATEESKVTGLDVGADDYLTKPFNKSELILKVRNTITSRTKIREKIRLELFTEAPKLEVLSGDEQFLIKVKEAIMNRLGDEQLSVESLAHEIGWSRAQFYRKVTALTGQPVSELIRSFRLQKAAQLLDQKWGPVSQVAYKVGFSNPSYFSKCFKDEFGVLPSEYESKK